MSKVVPIKIVNASSNPLPFYAKEGDAGMDLYAAEELVIAPCETKIVPTGIYVEIPVGYEIQIRPRSGQSAKTKIRIANAPGTIDSGYRNQIGVIVDNIGETEYKIAYGDRIAQAVLSEVPVIEWVPVHSTDEFSSSDRGANGFGSTGQ